MTLGRDRLAALDAAADFRRHRQELQAEQVTRLADTLPLPQLRLPQVFAAELGPPDVDTLAAALKEGVTALGTRRTLIGTLHG